MLAILLVILTLVLFVLKLGAVIAVSWLLVFTPLLILLVLWMISIVVLALAGAVLITAVFSALQRRR